MLSPGTKLGPYEVIAPIGAGGMGEVYRAKDTRLDRIVAIKILPEHLSSNPDFKLRFEREAKTISNLSHPHICALHDIGHQDGIDFLVMEFLEGETLTERLTKGPLPLEQVLRFGIQIADALDRAHKQSVVHRDLKPGNIMLTRSGAKLLDFGLAKMGAATTQPILTSVSALPTEHHNLTAEGMILGTLQYMAPEQLEGKEADARTDIFALGVVLYEMTTGKKAFTGKSQASLIAAILSSEPVPISTIQPMAPPSLERVVKNCMAKDPDDRWQTTHDVMLELKFIGEQSSHPISTPIPGTKKKNYRWLPWIVSSLLLLLLLITLPAAILYFQKKGVEKTTTIFEIAAPEKTEFGYSLAVSPDGRTLVFISSTAGKSQLWIRNFNSPSAQALPGTEDAIYPFWSPDSRFIGFFADGLLKKIDVSGRSSQTLCEVSMEPRGGTWNEEGVILFSPHAGEGLFQISSSGGKITPVTKLNKSKNESSHRWPYFLPGGKKFLYFSRQEMTLKGTIYVASLDSSENKSLLESDSGAIYSKSGYLLFVQEQSLVAQPFSISKLQVEGPTFLVSDDVKSIGEAGATGYSSISISDNDVLVYKAGDVDPITQLMWFDRKGTKIESIGVEGRLDEPALSPDGKRIAINNEDSKDGKRYVWLLEVNRGILSRLSFRQGDGTPVWSPDGNYVVFASRQKGPFPDLHWIPINKAGEDELLLEAEYAVWPNDWSRDGKYIIYEESDPKLRSDLWVLPTFGDRKPVEFLKSEFNESQAQLSPDGKWIAYSSDESGKPEVYVRRFPSKEGKLQISNAGGSMPSWRGDGKEIYYWALDRNIMSVNVNPTIDFEAGLPQPLFRVDFRRSELGWNKQYVPSNDGQRFLVNAVLTQTSRTPITVVMNWSAELKK